ncbi:glycosyltransferase [Leptothrix ochracea L12]|uniref:Glycosyltransferase n=1 Tax=Leptothrix ochracea L12 TaxID=735332 RepID=I4Z522_9BURK|nr:glycosyltransferase [Leptothrix ochracea]EIM31314.1 glycosyltransferase [Leptothrix ochracea L12]
MKVVHVIIGLGRGGAEMMLKRLVEAHQGNTSYQHEVISLTTMGVYGDALQAMGVPVHALGLRGVLGVPRVLWALQRLIRQIQPDVVQTWMYHADLLGGLAAKVAGGMPVIWGIHSLDLKRSGSHPTRVVQKLCAWSSSWLPSRILCVAEASRRVHVALGYDAQRITVIPNGFDAEPAPIAAEAVAALRAELGMTAGQVLIGCVGRFNPAKDHRNFVEAAARVAQRRPEARFLMVGTGLDKDNAILWSWIAVTGCAERFFLLGERSDVPRLLAAMDVFCSSSRTEAFPLVVGEAMVMARPSVVTDVGDTALLVGDTARVVERENPQALAQGLLDLLAMSAEDRAAMGGRAHARLQREFSMRRARERTEAVYAQVVASTKKGST